MNKMRQTIGGDCSGNETEGGDHKAALRQKRLKATTLKWRSSSNDMNSKVVEAGASEGISDEKVLCSLTTASFKSLISRKRVRTTLGKVAQQCDAIDPPVPRRLRSAMNKRARHVKKRRHLSAISAQISFLDQRTRFNETSLLPEEEEVADALLSLSQTPSTRDFTADKVIIAGSTNINASSTSYSEGTTKEGDKITRLPSAADELPACIVGRADNVPHVHQVPGATNQSNNTNPPVLENAQIKDPSSGVIANSPSPCRGSSSNSARKQLKLQLDGSSNYPAQKKPDAWLVSSNKPDNLIHEDGKAKNEEGTQEIMHRVQTPLPCTPDGYYLTKPSSSKLLVQASTVCERASGNLDKLALVHNGVPSTKETWKRSITHVYVSRLIQTRRNCRDKASSLCQVLLNPEERPHAHASRKSSSARDERTVRRWTSSDVRLPAVHQPCNAGAAPRRRKMVSGGEVLSSLATWTASPAGARARHVQYPPHPLQVTPRPGPTPPPPPPYPFPHLAPAAGTLHQQYVRDPGYAPRPGLALAADSSSAAVMRRIQQLMPTHQQQQEQVWRFHVAQYQPRLDGAAPGRAAAAAAVWHDDTPSLRPTMSMLAAPAQQMELLCAPYSRQQPHQLRLI